MDVGDFRYDAQAGAGFTVSLTLTVEDARALWSAAADRALAAPGMTLVDVLDTIGPREDPAIAECIAMLAAPAALPGCVLETFEVAEVTSQLVPPQIIQLPASHLLPRAARA